jgi:hypothetical protein
VDHYNTTRTNILSELQSSQSPGDKYLAAWFLSSGFRGSGRCLNWRGGLYKWQQMGSQEFRDYLRLRLLNFPIIPFNNVDGVRCPCRHGTDISNAPTHALDCSSNQALYIRRHDGVCKLLMTLIRVAMPGSQVSANMRVYGGEGSREAVISDLRVVNGSEVYVFDVTITDPGGKIHVTRNQAARREDAAAMAREHAKREKYTKVVGLCVSPQVLEDVHSSAQQKFIPFAVEATGRLGPMARQFLKKLNDDNPVFSHEISFFLYAMGACIARCNSQMITKCRDTVVLAPVSTIASGV